MTESGTEVAEVRTVAGAQGFIDLIGQELGTSQWHQVNQADIDAFGAVTRDEQWIHTDPERAADGPFGGTIAHGYYVLALIPYLARRTYRTEGAAMLINYGMNRVRFITPVASGSHVRAVFTVVGVAQGDDGFDVTLNVVIELRGGSRPACVAETIGRINIRKAEE